MTSWTSITYSSVKAFILIIIIIAIVVAKMQWKITSFYCTFTIIKVKNWLTQSLIIIGTSLIVTP